MRLWAQAASRRDSSQAKRPSRVLDYARNDKWGWTLEMTEGVDDNFVNDKIKNE